MGVSATRVLAESEWFCSLGPVLQAAILKAAKQRRLRDGTSAYRQGDPPDGLYVVIDGQVRLTSYSDEGAGFLLLLAGPGDWFGEVSTLDDGPRQQDASSYGASLVLHVSSGDLERIGQTSPRLWRAIGRLASLHQRAALRYIRSLISMPIDGRVVALLHAMASNRPGMPLSITHDEIARNVGSSRQTVNSILQRLQRQGLVKLGYRSITIHGGASIASGTPDRRPHRTGP